jgi:hypothetical protein
MGSDVVRKIIDLEWPTRYVLECGHAVAIAPDASVAEMAMPGALIGCPACSGSAEPAEAPGWLTLFKAGEAINALTLNARLAQIAERLGDAAALAPFAPDEPINADTLNARLRAIIQRLERP